MRRRKTGRRTLFGSSILPLFLIGIVVVAFLAYDKESNTFKLLGWEYNLDHIYKPKVEVVEQPKDTTTVNTVVVDTVTEEVESALLDSAQMNSISISTSGTVVSGDTLWIGDVPYIKN